MELQTWLDKNFTSGREFALKNGIALAYLYKIAKRQVTPGPRIMKVIMDATNGEVTKKDLIAADGKMRVCKCCGREL